MRARVRRRRPSPAAVLAAVLLALTAPASAASITDTRDTWTMHDIVALDATLDAGVLSVTVTERVRLDDLGAYFIEIFLDTDRDPATGDARFGTVAGQEYRVGCVLGMINGCTLYTLPTRYDGEEQLAEFVDIPGASFTVARERLTVHLPVAALGGTTGVDVFAITHGGGNGYDLDGNGDRCPDAGALDTAGGVVVRRPCVPVDATLADAAGDAGAGPDITSVRARCLGDQYELTFEFAAPWPAHDYNCAPGGEVTLDADRRLATGFRGMGREIPTWGADAVIDWQLCALADVLTLYWRVAYPASLLFGPPRNDGRFRVDGNRVVLAASASVFDPRVRPGRDAVRVAGDGRMALSAKTFDTLSLRDAAPGNGRVFDVNRGLVLEPHAWMPGRTVTAADPAEFGGVSGMDIIQVDAEIAGADLVVRGTLSRLDGTQVDNTFEVLLDTDGDVMTGEIVINDLTPELPAIGADYRLYAWSVDDQIYVGTYLDVVRPDGSTGQHDASILVSPTQGLGPGSFTVAIPLAAIGYPQQVRLFTATGDVEFGRYDIAPPFPLDVTTALADADGDGVPDAIDTCPGTPDPGQADADGDDAGDVCDCAPQDRGARALPGDVGAFGWAPGATTLAWDSAARVAGPATVHDVFREIESRGPPGTQPGATCLASGLLGATLASPEPPAPGTAFRYLVRGRNACGPGTWGRGSAGDERLVPACP